MADPASEAQRLVPSPVTAAPKRPSRGLLSLVVLGGICLVAWVVIAAVGWAIAAAPRTSVSDGRTSPIVVLNPQASFAVVTLGSGGGPYEDDVSGYLLRALAGQPAKPWVALDGGAALGGLRAAAKNGVFADVQIPAVDSWMSLDRYVMQKLVTHHLIGHTHLDHVLGIVSSTAEVTFQGSNRTLWGLDFVTAGLSSSVFNNILWPALQNFPGSGLSLNTLPALLPFDLEDSGLQVTAFPLAHGDVNSTAFLLKSPSNASLLYLSDVMPDACHWNAKNQTCVVTEVNNALWGEMAPLVKDGSLKAIMIEASYPSSRPDNILFGHLTPCYVLQELRVLASLACTGNLTSCLRGVTVFITHIKAWWPSQTAAKQGLTPRGVIERELTTEPTLHGTPAPKSESSGCSPQTNDLGVAFVFADRGFQYNV